MYETDGRLVVSSVDLKQNRQGPPGTWVCELVWVHMCPMVSAPWCVYYEDSIVGKEAVAMATICMVTLGKQVSYEQSWADNLVRVGIRPCP